MSGRNPPLYCRITLIAMQGHQQSIDKRHDHFGSRIGWVSMKEKEIFESWMDVEYTIGNCPITFPTVHTVLTSTIIATMVYQVQIKET